MLQARGGKDYIIAYGRGDHAVVRGDIFERTYEPLGGGLYRKRTDMCCATSRWIAPVHRARRWKARSAPRAGDWIMQGVAGELWPVPRDKALEKYEPV